MRTAIKLPGPQLSELCQRHHIRKLSLFGSALRDDFRPDSDVDVLVEFEPGCIPGFIRLAGIEMELSELLGRKVDLNTPHSFSRPLRDRVLHEAEIQYVEQG